MSASYCLVGEAVSVFKKNKLSPSLRKKARRGRRDAWDFGKEGREKARERERSHRGVRCFRGRCQEGWVVNGEKKKKPWVRGTEIEVNGEEQNEALLGRPHLFRRA